MKTEWCVVCKEPTGKAGKDDDSLYTSDLKGPFCESCFPKYLGDSCPVCNCDETEVVSVKRCGMCEHLWGQYAEYQQAELARLRRIEQAARKVVTLWDDGFIVDGPGDFCGLPAIDALRAALESQP